MKEFLKGKLYAKKSITLEGLRTAIVFLNEELIVISSVLVRTVITLSIGAKRNVKYIM